ncbi:hypothetical protein [Sphaerothrix gracilis]|uniref:hypothetical protein n=1 Tax=Sphaerothrix gracilis TaxID=3151835 RepID=UPI0031FC3CEE
MKRRIILTEPSHTRWLSAVEARTPADVPFDFAQGTWVVSNLRSKGAVQALIVSPQPTSFQKL